MKELICLASLLIALTANGQGRLRPNPGNPIAITTFAAVPIDNDFLFISFTVRGIGLWRAVEVTTGNQTREIARGIGYGNSRVYSVIIPANDYVSIFFDLANRKGVPPGLP